MTTTDESVITEAPPGQTLSGVAKILGRALRALGDAGRPEQASEFAAQAWTLVRETSPTDAARLTGLLHKLAHSAPVGTGIGSARGAGDPGLDVRADAPARRHAMIFEAFHALEPGTGFILINDHDPKPLYYQFAAEHPGDFEWAPLEEGPEVWRVRIGRPAASVPAPAPLTIRVVELSDIASLVLQGLRARVGDTVTIHDPEAIAAWRRLDATLVPGPLQHAEPRWLAALLLDIAGDAEEEDEAS